MMIFNHISENDFRNYFPFMKTDQAFYCRRNFQRHGVKISHASMHNATKNIWDHHHCVRVEKCVKHSSRVHVFLDAVIRISVFCSLFMLQMICLQRSDAIAENMLTLKLYGVAHNEMVSLASRRGSQCTFSLCNKVLRFSWLSDQQ